MKETLNELSRFLWRTFAAWTVAFLKIHPTLQFLAAGAGIVLLIVGVAATVMWKVPILTWLDGSQVAIPSLAASIYLLGVWFLSRQEEFHISPIQESGANIYHCYRGQDRESSERFFVKLNFEFWTKQQIELINIGLSYSSPGLPQRPKIEIDSTDQAYEQLDGFFRLKNRRTLDAGKVIRVFISQEFAGLPDESADYGTATIDIEFAGSEWQGVQCLHASGELAAGGRWENVNFTVSPK